MKSFTWIKLSMVVVLFVALVPGTARGLSFNWSFTNSSSGTVAGPVTGTIGFSTLVSGAGGVHTADFYTIDSAPGHSFSNGYVLGSEIFGSPLVWDEFSNNPFTFTAADVATSGDLGFRDPGNFTLLMDFRSPAQNSFFRSGPPNLITAGGPTWTAIQVPEPSSLALAGVVISLCSMCRRYRR